MRTLDFSQLLLQLHSQYELQIFDRTMSNLTMATPEAFHTMGVLALTTASFLLALGLACLMVYIFAYM